MASIVLHRPHLKKRSSKQPVDRHLAEIGDFNGPICINAGIDSTCTKITRRIYQLENGIVMNSSPPSSLSSPTSSMTSTRMNGHHDDDLLPVLMNSSHHYDQHETINNGCCAYCGK